MEKHEYGANVILILLTHWQCIVFTGMGLVQSGTYNDYFRQYRLRSDNKLPKYTQSWDYMSFKS